MRKLWEKASVGLTLGLVVGGVNASHAQTPTRAEELQREASQSPLDMALQDEVFSSSAPSGFSPVQHAVGYYCPPRQFGLPPMIGDFFPGYTGGARQATILDRLLVVADDLDAPDPLPGADQLLTITEAGPVGIFRTSVQSVQEIQALLRAGQPLPMSTQVGMVNDDATVTTAISVGQIQSLLASTPGVAFDVIPVVAPPGTYQSAVDAVFQANNATAGVTTFNTGGSGALLQGGDDTLDAGDDLDAFYFYEYVLTVGVPTPSAGTGGVGRSRIAENGTTTPQDRVYFDYGLFDRVGFVAGSSRVHRYAPGFEKTFAQGMASLELRMPFATTVEDNIFENGSTSLDELHFGNLALYLKALVLQNETSGVSAGLGTIFPTADGFDVTFVNGGRLLEVDNESYHLQPFLAGYYAPNNRFFTQAFAQLDFDVNGNPVAINSTGMGLQDAGRLTDATFLFLDWSAGYWIMRGGDAPVLPISSFHEHGQITQSNFQLGLAPTMELHYTRSLDSVDTVSSGLIQVGNFADEVETLTLVLGTHLEIGQDTNIGLGYATAIAGGNDEPFDGSFRLTLNRFFGRQ